VERRGQGRLVQPDLVHVIDGKPEHELLPDELYPAAFWSCDNHSQLSR
jgi:hypothetical protein